MNLPLFISRRYLVARKSHNAINIISAISVLGVATGTMALIVILSVFNGFDELVKSLINSFNPDIKVTAVEGKVFVPPDKALEKLRALPGVYDLSLVLEDKALLRYDQNQTTAVVKGVSDNYANITGLDSMLVEGEYRLQRGQEPMAVIGRGIRIYLNVILLSPRQITAYVPHRASGITLDANRALNRNYISASGVFSAEQDYDMNYIIVPIAFSRDLFDYTHGEVSVLEIKLRPDANEKQTQASIQSLLGPQFEVQNRYQQNGVFYKTMQAEKWAIFLILIFILIIASFNVIGTLTMLILEKKKDITTLNDLGADRRLLKRIFLYEGWMISTVGAIAGTITGLLICWLQMHFGIIKLQGSGSFIIDAYPVVIKATDVALTFVAVVIISGFTSWYPIRYFSKKHLNTPNE